MNKPTKTEYLLQKGNQLLTTDNKEEIDKLKLDETIDAIYEVKTTKIK